MTFLQIDCYMLYTPAETVEFCSGLCLQTSCEVHPASYPVGTGGPFLGGKARPERDADHSTLSSAEVRKE
jgi:hypothetical protein